MKIKLHIGFVVVLFASVSLAQTYPQDLSFSDRTDALLDAGVLWQINSNAHPLRALPVSEYSNNPIQTSAFMWMRRYLDEYTADIYRAREGSETGFGILLMPGMAARYQDGADRLYDEFALEPFLWAQAFYHQRWYATVYVRATNEAASLRHYNGVERDISRFGLDSGEIDRALIGYQHKGVKLEIGRGRQIWGQVSEDNLTLSGDAPAWEGLSFQLRHRRFSFRYFFGQLGTKYDDYYDVNIQRYLVGKAVEYSNSRNLVVCAGELSTYAGPNRSVDLALINPLSLHLEVEQNNRENNQSRNSSKYVWFFDVDWLALDKLRLTGSLLLDEFQIDRSDYREGVADALGMMGRVAWTPLKRGFGLTLFATAVNIDSYVYMHNYRYTNSVNFGRLIGHPLGNDGEDYSIGMRLVSEYPVMLEAVYGRRRWGDESLHLDPYRTYPDGFPRQSFPSGEVRTNRYLSLRIDSQINRRLHFGIDGWLDIDHHGPDSALERWTFTLRYMLPVVLTGL